MEALRARWVGGLVIVIGASVASCVSHGERPLPEHVGHTAAALAPTIVRRGTAHRVCQLIGERDYGVDELLLTTSQTASRYGIGHTDLGYPVGQQDGTVWFFFGDTTVAQDNADPLGHTTDKPYDADGNDFCPQVDFSVFHGTAQQQAIRLDGLIKGGFTELLQ